MNYTNYQKYISSETMMGPNSVRVLDELFQKHPLKLDADSKILDLGCGTGLTSLVVAKETGAGIWANDLWVKAEDNQKRFDQWRVGRQITPVCEDANHLQFDIQNFDAVTSVDSYHYFAGNKGFFAEKILPFIKNGGTVLIGIPGIKNEYEGRAEELLSDWLGDESYMFKSPKNWKILIGNDARIETVETWEMECFDTAWNDWLKCDNPFALGDKKYFANIIKPYTCFVGIYVKLKK